MAREPKKPGKREIEGENGEGRGDGGEEKILPGRGAAGNGKMRPEYASRGAQRLPLSFSSVSPHPCQRVSVLAPDSGAPPVTEPFLLPALPDPD